MSTVIESVFLRVLYLQMDIFILTKYSNHNLNSNMADKQIKYFTQ